MRRFHEVRGLIVGLAFSPDGKALMACVRGGMTVPVWDLGTGAFRRWHPHAGLPVSALAFAPDGKWLAVGGEVGTVRPYRYPELTYEAEFHPGQDDDMPVFGVAFGWAEGRTDCRLAMASRRLTTARVGAGERDTPLHGDETGSFTGVALSPAGRELAAVQSWGRRLWMWDVWAGGPPRIARLGAGPVSVCFTADGGAVAVAMAARVEFRDPASLRLRAAWRHRRRVAQVAAHPARNLIASAGTDGTVRLWDADAGAEGAVYDWGIGRLSAVAFAPDGLTCAAGGEKGQVVVWDVDA